MSPQGAIRYNAPHCYGLVILRN